MISEIIPLKDCRNWVGNGWMEYLKRIENRGKHGHRQHIIGISREWSSSPSNISQTTISPDTCNVPPGDDCICHEAANKHKNSITITSSSFIFLAGSDGERGSIICVSPARKARVVQIADLLGKKKKECPASAIKGCILFADFISMICTTTNKSVWFLCDSEIVLAVL